MPRKIIITENNEYYHVFNRGVDKRIIFNDTEDYVRFYQSLYFFNTLEPVVNLSFAKLQNYQNIQPLVEIRAYCLLDNHFHLLLKQLSENGVSEFMKRISGGYTSYFNKKNDRSGILFQGTYKKVHIENDEQYNYLFAYINENHHVHQLAEPSQIYQTSSLHYRKKMKSKNILTDVEEYQYIENIRLAKDIFKQREKLKSQLFEI